MSLDREQCARARLARDARFDGKFFIGVLSTGIYCRPICRARTSQEKNVRYFLSAAAAAEAGFRPCLRCRPESSPGTPAWAGTKSTVCRALRLINEMGLEEGGVEALAGHLGLGARHLRRLFLRHLGATPTAVAHTRRLHFAKRLIDETGLPMTQIAIAAGFGSVRRFNAAIRKVYRRTPTEIRSRAPRKTDLAPNQYLFRLDFRPPYGWQRMLEVFAMQAIPGVELVEAGCYRRCIQLDQSQGLLEVSREQGRNALTVRVELDEPRSLFYITERVRAMFDLNADWPTIERTLAADPVLAARIGADPGLRVPGCWSGFELATRAILGQSLSTARTSALAARMVTAFGTHFAPAPGLTHLFPSPAVLAEADLQGAGLPKARSEAVRSLAQAVLARRISFERVANPEAVLARLAEIPGIADCTVQYVAMRALREPDAFPIVERDLLLALALADPADLPMRSLAWRPWRSYAAEYLCTSLHGVPS